MDNTKILFLFSVRDSLKITEGFEYWYAKLSDHVTGILNSEVNLFLESYLN